MVDSTGFSRRSSSWSTEPLGGGERPLAHKRQAELPPEAPVDRGLELRVDAPHVTEHPSQVGHPDGFLGLTP